MRPTPCQPQVPPPCRLVSGPRGVPGRNPPCLPGTPRFRVCGRSGSRLSVVKALVLGSGAREHALVRALSADADVEAVIVAPGNPGMDAIALCERLPGGLLDGDGVVEIARRHDVDLVVIGPEAPLVAGVADTVRAAGLSCFGPGLEAARLEGSKSFAKEIMAAADVPTGLAHVCVTLAEVEDALDALGAPHVVKDDGLAAGKGVVVTEDRDEALAHAATCLAHQDGRVVVEEFLEGPEASVFCITDGETVLAMSPAQDFKRIGEGDTGPNTGGMGAYSPLDWAPDGLVEDVLSRIAQPVVDEMRRRGTPFAGVLYVGLALTRRGPRVIEFNARFGDPEIQSVLARLQTPLGGLLKAAADGGLADFGPLRWSADHAVTVVLASAGYPATSSNGDPVDGLEAATPDDRAYVLHAGTAISADGRLVTAGGRVLSVVATGSSLAKARKRAYAVVDRIQIEGGQCRRDIARAAERGEITLA